MVKLKFPPLAGDRGPGYWMRPGNVWAARRKISRPDQSTIWRDNFSGTMRTSRTVRFADLLTAEVARSDRFRFLILGDTGEGDRSQYGLLPLIRALHPDFMLIAGDVAYPAGRTSSNPRQDDYICGLFQPYQGLNCPIWAVPGNHEYYSESKGFEFYQVFCTDTFADYWHRYGLHFVSQPGTYWELADGDAANDLVVIGVDTGQCANLDGGRPWWQIWKSKPRRDEKQYTWLSERLKRADECLQKVIVIFHIPGLVRGDHDKSTRFAELHRMLASHPCVRLIVAGHEHNFQEYEPAQFARYLEVVHSAKPAAGVTPRYLVAGGSGAYLTSTDFKPGRFQCVAYPATDQWQKYAGIGRQFIAKIGLDKSPVARAAALAEKNVLTDSDAASFLSLILVDVVKASVTGPAVTTVTPVFMDDLETLYPGDMDVDVQAGIPPLAPHFVDKCIQSHRSFNL